MNGKRKFASPSVMQVKKWQKAINIEEKLDILGQLEKGNKLMSISVQQETASVV